MKKWTFSVKRNRWLFSFSFFMKNWCLRKEKKKKNDANKKCKHNEKPTKDYYIKLETTKKLSEGAA